MPSLLHKTVICPHCGHTVQVDLDASEGDQNYYEDCPACCHPIHLSFHVDEQHQTINLFIDADDEQYF